MKPQQPEKTKNNRSSETNTAKNARCQGLPTAFLSGLLREGGEGDAAAARGACTKSRESRFNTNDGCSVIDIIRQNSIPWINSHTNRHPGEHLQQNAAVNLTTKAMAHTYGYEPQQAPVTQINRAEQLHIHSCFSGMYVFRR